MKLINYFGYLRPGGGPAGYLYNLNTAVANGNSKNIVVLSDSVGDERTVKKEKAPRFKLLSSFLFMLRTILRQFKPISPSIKIKLKSFSSNDVLVFHSIPDVTKYRATNSINNKYLLMIHSPKEPNLETFDLVKKDFGNNIFIKIAQKIVKYEEYKAIENAFGINIPAKGAMDAYYKNDHSMQELLASKKMYRVVSGVPTVKPTQKKCLVKESLSLPKSKKIVGFFGRYNKDKGFDNYLKYIDLMKHDKEIFFISAGSGYLKANNTWENYIDLGWRTDAINLINICDFIIVPNNIAYFDLIILEALSLGKEVITTNAGGAKGLINGSVHYINTQCSMEDQVRELSVILHGTIRNEKIIKDIYEKNYSLNSFLHEYESLYCLITKETNDEV